MQKNWKKKGGGIRKFFNGLVVLFLLLSVGFPCSLVFAEALNQEVVSEAPTEGMMDSGASETDESTETEPSYTQESSEPGVPESSTEYTEPTVEESEEQSEPAPKDDYEQPEAEEVPEKVAEEQELAMRQSAGLTNSIAVVSGGVTQDITLESPDFNPSLVYAQAGDTLKFTVIFTRPADVNVKSYTMKLFFDKRAKYQKTDNTLVEIRRSYPNIPVSDQISYNTWAPVGDGAEMSAYQSVGSDPIKSDIIFTFELNLKNNLTGFDLMSFNTNLSVTLEGLGEQIYNDSSYYWINLKDNQPTELSWNNASLEENKTISSHDISEQLSTTFYWSDPDTMAAYLPDGFILEDGSGYEHIETRANDHVNSGTVTISLDEYLKRKPYGTNQLTVKAYKEDGAGRKTYVSNTITLNLTVVGTVSWVSVTDKMNWTLTAGQEMTEPLARSENLNVLVKDSRSDNDRTNAPWKLSVSARNNGSEAYPFSLVWKNTGEPASDLGDTGSVVYTSGAELTTPDPQQPFVFQKSWQTDEGILLKVNGTPEIGRVYEEPILVSWTLVDASRGT
ncbi:hypothetical protein [Enterococcus sp. BWR-S5]|uniref:hypothetical protein n=1 Tax=Enterococcus sp. BWR-S5 TaxID=2787714 RepID=UPI0019242010|nr:hypothetical protein [Enterococcus sp. BWR-S5]MBL1224241.1 hypothetical protein [Enterococcus sp. BWR-S5]